jgi:rubredoxin
MEREKPSWRCTICGYVDGGDAPPAHCPECDARDAMFVASDEQPHGIPHNPLQPRDERDQTAFHVGPGHGCLEED